MVAGVGPLGWSGPGGPGRDGGPVLDGAGAEPGRGGRACSYIKTTEGKSGIFTGFSRKVSDISLVLPDFFRGKNPGNSRGKSGAITNRNLTLSIINFKIY